MSPHMNLFEGFTSLEFPVPTDTGRAADSTDRNAAIGGVREGRLELPRPLGHPILRLLGSRNGFRFSVSSRARACRPVVSKCEQGVVGRPWIPGETRVRPALLDVAR